MLKVWGRCGKGFCEAFLNSNKFKEMGERQRTNERTNGKKEERKRKKRQRERELKRHVKRGACQHGNQNKTKTRR